MLRSALMRINKTGVNGIIQLPCSFGRAPILGANVLWGKKAGLLSNARASHREASRVLEHIPVPSGCTFVRNGRVRRSCLDLWGTPYPSRES